MSCFVLIASLSRAARFLDRCLLCSCHCQGVVLAKGEPDSRNGGYFSCFCYMSSTEVRADGTLAAVEILAHTEDSGKLKTDFIIDPIVSFFLCIDLAKDMLETRVTANWLSEVETGSRRPQRAA